MQSYLLLPRARNQFFLIGTCYRVTGKMKQKKKSAIIIIFTIAYKCDNACLHSAHVPIEREAHRSSSSRVENRSHKSLFSPRQPIRHNIYFANCSHALTIRNITKRGDIPYRHSIGTYKLFVRNTRY